MNNSVFKFALDISREGSQIQIPVRLYDTGRTFKINLTDGGKPYTIGVGVTAIFVAHKPDGTCSYDECSIIGDTVIYKFKKNTAIIDGTYDCEIRLIGEDEETLTSPSFTMIVRARVAEDEDMDISDNDHSILDNAIANEKARLEAEENRNEAELKRENAEEERKKAAEEIIAEANATILKLLNVIADLGGSFGVDCVVGCRGYYWKSIDTTNKKIYLSHEQVKKPTKGASDIDTEFEAPKYNKGAKISIFNGKLYRSNAYISEISHNVIKYTGNIGFSEIAEPSSRISAPYKDEYSLFVESQPEVGPCVVRYGAFAAGFGGASIGNGSAHFGIDGEASDDGALAVGILTKATKRGAFSGGMLTEATADRATALGFSTKATGDQSLSTGLYSEASASAADAGNVETKAKHKGATTRGLGTRSSAMYQLVCGTYNADNPNALLIVGCGTSENDRRNSLEVCVDGNSAYIVVGGTRVNIP